RARVIDVCQGGPGPPGWTAKSVRAAILLRHPKLEVAFEKGSGLDLMFTESKMMVRVLLRLGDSCRSAASRPQSLQTDVGFQDDNRPPPDEQSSRTGAISRLPDRPE